MGDRLLVAACRQYSSDAVGSRIRYMHRHEANGRINVSGRAGGGWRSTCRLLVVFVV